jgi:hypothetical protein
MRQLAYATTGDAATISTAARTLKISPVTNARSTAEMVALEEDQARFSTTRRDTYGNAASFLKRTRLSVHRTAVTPSG